MAVDTTAATRLCRPIPVRIESLRASARFTPGRASASLARSNNGSIIQEATLLPPEFFAECIAGLEQPQDGAVEVDAECLIP